MGRVLFGGITVERPKDVAASRDPGASAGNAASLARAAAHVARGNALLVFPEGERSLDGHWALRT